ncbi:hypothetical protein ACJMK2_000337 [Sinanodonta woodiana]|uniref:OTU domain-containing protein n=1 Tax=Sinanodonta woodiana TaxID=1069815 RepID=A0ABD3XPG3_SINWO
MFAVHSHIVYTAKFTDRDTRSVIWLPKVTTCAVYINYKSSCSDNMATGGEEETVYNLFEVGRESVDSGDLDLQGVVVRDNLVITVSQSKNFCVYRRDDCRLLSSVRLDSFPYGMCRVSYTDLCVSMWNGTIVFISVQDSGQISMDTPLRLEYSLNDSMDRDEIDYMPLKRSSEDLSNVHCQGVAVWNEQIVFSVLIGNTIYLCSAGLIARPRNIRLALRSAILHEVCRGLASFLVVKQDMVYIAFLALSPGNTGVCRFNLENPSQQTHIYQSTEMQPCGITVSDNGFVFVCDSRNSSIYHLTSTCDLLSIYKEGIPHSPYGIFWDRGVLYLASFDTFDTYHEHQLDHETPIERRLQHFEFFMHRPQQVLKLTMYIPLQEVSCSHPCTLDQLLWKSQQDALPILSILETNCLSLGLELHGETPADGNCFFEAVSSQLQRLNYVVQKTPQELRQEVVKFMRNNREIEVPNDTIHLENFIDESFDIYCSRMARDGEWVDHVVVVAMARMLQMDIMIVTSSPSSGPEDIIVWVEGQTAFQGNPILLGHVWESHYLSLQPIGNTDIKDPVLTQAHDLRAKTMSVPNYQFRGVPCSDPILLGQRLKKSQQAALSSQSTLEANCLSLDMVLHGETPADGNCFFEAVSNQLRRLTVQKSPQELRQEVVAFMRDNRVIQVSKGTLHLESFIYNESFDVYCSRMARDGEWADHVVVVAMARMLQIDIIIVTSSGHQDIIVRVVGQTAFQGNPILLGHVSKSHYISLQSKEIRAGNRLVQIAYSLPVVGARVLGRLLQCHTVTPAFVTEIDVWNISVSHQQRIMIQTLQDKINTIYALALSVKKSVNLNDYMAIWNDICRLLEALSKECGDSDFENEISREIQNIQVSTVQGTSLLDKLRRHPSMVKDLEMLVHDTESDDSDS